MTARIETFDVASLQPAPWKSGGGVTREVVRVPAGSDLDSFDWRVSIAELTTDGSFSSFPGVDRVIALLDGAGVHMRSPDGQIDQRLTTPLTPFAFSGDVPVDASLVVGPSRDLNVMTRRVRARADVRVLREPQKVPCAESGLLFAARGRWRAQDGGGRRAYSFAPGAGVWWDRQPLEWDLLPMDMDNAIVVVSVARLPEHAPAD
jgi:environmental stress-induced protein Ves